MKCTIRNTSFQIQDIIQAAGSVCEWCREQVDPLQIQILWSQNLHNQYLHHSIIILCPTCYCSLYRFRIPPALLKYITNRRPYHTRSALRRILGVHEPPYFAPDTFDLADLYRDACSGWCLNGSG